ncbi:GH3 auxin-responsive promoter family protein [Mycoplasmatota bacterium WC44]
MANLQTLLSQGEYEKIWNKYCGFLDLDLNEFMEIQERLLMEQIEYFSNCELGKKIMGEGVKPTSVEEFRNMVPLTTYDDYADILLSKKEEALPAKPLHWIKTTWKGGTHDIKLAPYSEEMIDEHAKSFTAALILATSKTKGEFSLREFDKFLYGMAPLPYLTGLAPHGLKKEIDFDYLPSIEEAESLGFEERNKVGFELALSKGVDLFFGLSSVLVKIGEDFANSSNNKKKIIKPKSFKMLIRLVRAYIKKNIKKETILPKDVFEFKGILCAGTDTHAYKDKIEHYWGKRPIEIFGGTELATVAIETWGGNGLTFFPDVNFLEFIPEEESVRSMHDKNFIPKTLLINELKANERYELVITKFRGGAFVRYRVGDMMECVALEDKEYNIKLPQVRYVDRLSNIIDLAGFTRITQATIDEAINSSDYEVKNWVASKDYVKDEPILHLTLEIDGSDTDTLNVKKIINENLQKLDNDYKDFEEMLGRDPLRITLLPSGTFDNFLKQNRKPINKMNPSKEDLEKLINVT